MPAAFGGVMALAMFNPKHLLAPQTGPAPPGSQQPKLLLAVKNSPRPEPAATSTAAALTKANQPKPNKPLALIPQLAAPLPATRTEPYI